MKVSVIVPVFNTGPSIEALIDSLRAQTLPAGEWEAVFVDDGSSDDTPDLIEGLIAGDANMRLLREAPSGWPGRPRNVGVDAARGDYVFFSDDDDTLGPEALERLTAFASANGSDVVIPRTVGRNRGVPLIPRTIVDAHDETAMIMGSLAPQKLFRTAFLREEGIRFQEGHFRLEDHLFVVTSYLRAKRVSVYADYPCYYLAYEAGRAHISQQKPDWHGYFTSIRACLDRVDAESTDPERRRIMRSRWLRAEVISRLRGDGHAKLATPELLHEARQLILDRYDDTDLEPLKPVDRMLAELLAAGRDEDVAALARWESGLLVTTVASGARTNADGTAAISLRSTLTAQEPMPALSDGAGRLPSAEAMLEQVAAYTAVGVELQHSSTKVRRLLSVEHLDEGAAIATLDLGDEPLANGRWTVVALAGEHRSRRRRPVAAEEGLPVAQTRRRIGDRVLEFEATERLAFRVKTSVAPTPVPLMTRVKRRIRRAIPRAIPTPRLRPLGG